MPQNIRSAPSDIMVMDDHGTRFEPEKRVRLRNTVDPSIYGDFACVGNEGWVKDRRNDRFGMQEVFIHWDINHWAYNGVQDSWTFPEHFEPVEEIMSNQSKGEQAVALIMDFAQRFGSMLTDKPEEQESTQQDLTSRIIDAARPFMKSQAEETNDEYEQTVQGLVEKLLGSDAYIVLGVDSKDPQHPEMMEPFAFGNARSPLAELLTQRHLAMIASRAHSDLIMKVAQQIES